MALSVACVVASSRSTATSTPVVSALPASDEATATRQAIIAPTVVTRAIRIATILLKRFDEPFITRLSLLGKRIQHQPHVLAERVQDRAGTAVLTIRLDFGPHLGGRAAGRDALDQFVGHVLHGCVNLLFRR